MNAKIKKIKGFHRRYKVKKVDSVAKQDYRLETSALPYEPNGGQPKSEIRCQSLVRANQHSDTPQRGQVFP